MFRYDAKRIILYYVDKPITRSGKHVIICAFKEIILKKERIYRNKHRRKAFCISCGLLTFNPLAYQWQFNDFGCRPRLFALRKRNFENIAND